VFQPKQWAEKEARKTIENKPNPNLCPRTLFEVPLSVGRATRTCWRCASISTGRMSTGQPRDFGGRVTGHRRLCFHLPYARYARHVGRQRRQGRKNGDVGAGPDTDGRLRSIVRAPRQCRSPYVQRSHAPATKRRWRWIGQDDGLCTSWMAETPNDPRRSYAPAVGISGRCLDDP